MEFNVNRKNFFKTVSIIILISGLIVGVICGKEIPIRELNISKVTSALTIGKSIDTDAYNESFNTVAMLSVWGSSILLSLFFYAIHSVLHALYLFIFKLYGTSDLNAIDAIYEPTQNTDDTSSIEQ